MVSSVPTHVSVPLVFVSMEFAAGPHSSLQRLDRYVETDSSKFPKSVTMQTRVTSMVALSTVSLNSESVETAECRRRSGSSANLPRMIPPFPSPAELTAASFRLSAAMEN